MRSRLFTLMFIAFFTMSFAACSKKDPALIGTWHTQGSDLTFNSDGTFQRTDWATTGATGGGTYSAR